MHSLAGSNVAEDRFYNSQSFTVSTATLWRVDLLLHLIGKASGAFTIEDMNLPRYSFRIAQTF